MKRPQKQVAPVGAREPDLPSKRKRRRSPGEMEDIGRVLEDLRLFRGLTVKGFAGRANLSPGLLSAVAYRRKRLTAEVLETLHQKLQLTATEYDRLRRAAADSHGYLLTTGLGVPADQLFRREREKDVKEVWIVDPAPKEEFDNAWLGHVVGNLLRDCEYVYFATDRPHAERIGIRLRDGLKDKPGPAKTVRLQFVVVPATLRPYFFYPTRVLLRLRESAEYMWEGMWSFGGPGSASAERGAPMAPEVVTLLHGELARILGRLRGSLSTFADDPLEFILITKELTTSS